MHENIDNINNKTGVIMLKMKYIKKILIPLTASAAAVLIYTTAYSEKQSVMINLTTRINTAGDDYAPSLTEDGTTSVFNSRMPEELSHNIFICRLKNGFWSDPYPAFIKNFESNDETPFISADGKTLLFASDRPGGFSPPVTSDGKKRITFDIYLSRLVNGKWTEPEILKGTVNTSMNERAPGLSRDGRTLYFTRWPYNSPGKSKIYSARLVDGEYSDVKELPESINTGNFEIGLRPSYKSGKYYFASRRPGGFGGWDIYYTTIKGNGFTKPVNAGETINTPYDDMYYSESKINSMICSDRAGGLGKFDLYSTFPAEKLTAADIKKTGSIKTSSVLRITAKDKKSGKLLKNKLFRVILTGSREKEPFTLRKIQAKSSSRGLFTINPRDDVDSVVIEPVSKKYSHNSIKINVKPGRMQEITIYLGKNSSASEKPETGADSGIKSDNSETGNFPALRNVYFRFNSSEISTEYIPELHDIVEFMRSNPEFRIMISGYSDPLGSSGSNLKLSRERAMNVSEFIKSLGIDEGRITVKWFGETKSVSGKKGSRYYSIDRKVELVLKK